MGLLHQELDTFLAEVEVPVQTAESRIELALEEFGTKQFTRKDYLSLHKDISAPTGSNDLAFAVTEGKLKRLGDKRTSRYQVVSG